MSIFGVAAAPYGDAYAQQQQQQQQPTPSWTIWQDDAPASSTSTIPGSPADQANKLRGPWLQTQLAIALTVGFLSFLSFCFLRTRSKVLYAPRTLLKGFSPHEVHSKSTFFGWILPTLRTSEFTVLQIVGLDAVVLLNFFKMGFYFFGICSLLAGVALVPINYRENGTSEGVPPPAEDDDDQGSASLSGALMRLASKSNKETYHGSTLYLTSHLIFTYIFSLLALYLLYRTYRAFVHTRQLFSLEHALSIPARTVLITSLPHHLRNERVLAQYWADLGLTVESVSVGRNVGSLHYLLEERTAKLYALETAWMQYVGNPVSKKALEAGYRHHDLVRRIVEDEDGREEGGLQGERARTSDEDGRLVDISPSNPPSRTAQGDEDASNGHDDIETGLEASKNRTTTRLFELPGKSRPLTRTSVFGRKDVDLLDHLAHQYRVADEAVQKRRQGRFKPSNVAFVTFADLASAQIAAQVAHYPQPDSMTTVLAPDPRDIHWHNMLLSTSSIQARQVLVFGAIVALLFTWAIPVSALARLLSLEAIRETLPWLARILDRNERIRVLVQNSLPSLAIIAFNGLLPFALDWLSILQGLRSRSEIEYALLVKYHFFLLINTFFLIVAVSTWDLARDLADQPMKFINKLALSLPGARNFFLSYVLLQGLGIMPLQLVQLAVILPRWFYRIFFTRTPRDFAELNTPPIISLGTIYPQALLIFLICLTYSVISPLILPFGAVYFGMGYLVYKYKLLFVYFRPYESRGQAWPLSFARMCWGLIIFQLFMTGLFLLREAALLTLLMIPLLLFTLYTSISLHRRFSPLSKYVNLAQSAEVKRAQSDGGAHYEAGALASDVERLRKGHPVSHSQTELNRGRYESSEDTMYVVKQDQKTDYAQPPMSESYYGVLNTGRRRYNHPAIAGRLPTPWLPAGAAEYNAAASDILPSSSDIQAVQAPLDIDLSSSGAVLIDIRRRFTDMGNVAKRVAVSGVERILPSSSRARQNSGGLRDESEYIENSTDVWARDGRQATPSVASSGGNGAGGQDESDEDDEHTPAGRYTFFPHRERQNRKRSGYGVGTGEEDGSDGEDATDGPAAGASS